MLKFIDDIVFLRSVEIGAISTFRAEVVYVSDRSEVMVNVEASQNDPQSSVEKLTNKFHFLFGFDEGCAPEIMFESFEESLKYVEGRRRYFWNYEEQ